MDTVSLTDNDVSCVERVRGGAERLRFECFINVALNRLGPFNSQIQRKFLQMVPQNETNHVFVTNMR